MRLSNKLLFAVSFCLVSFCLVSLCFIGFCLIGFCLVSFCLISICFIRFCLVSLCLVSLCLIGVSVCRAVSSKTRFGRLFQGLFRTALSGALSGAQSKPAAGSVGLFFWASLFRGFCSFFLLAFLGTFRGLFSIFFGTLSHPPPSLIIIKIHSRQPREGSIYPHFVHSYTAFCPHLFCHIDPPNVPNMDQKLTPNVP